MRDHLNCVHASHAAIQATRDDYEAACAAHEAHRDTLTPECELEALELRREECAADLIVAIAEAVVAQGKLLAEHIALVHK
jgi:hypothetical protein